MTTALGVVRDDAPENRNEAAARRLRGKFAELRLSASAVARDIGMTQAAISRRMLGKTELTLTEIDAICQATGISYEYVVLGRETTNPHPGGPDGGIFTMRARRDSNPQPSDPYYAGPRSARIPYPRSVELVPIRTPLVAA